jgi:circadian clock protein KaiB
MSQAKPNITGDLPDRSNLSKQHYVLRLYVAGITSRSTAAIRNTTALCEKYLRGRFDLQVIDIYQQPALAQKEQIVAAPTLVKKMPLPFRKFIGDMACEDKLLAGLELGGKR